MKKAPANFRKGSIAFFFGTASWARIEAQRRLSATVQTTERSKQPTMNHIVVAEVTGNILKVDCSVVD
jgi:hypothetical protein